MKLNLDQLFLNLKQKLPPVYLLTGDEVLFMQEAAMAIQSAAEKTGFSERIKFAVETGFNWTLFQQAYRNASLFSDKQCLVLDLSTGGKLSEAGKTILMTCLEKPNPSKLLLMLMSKTDAATQKQNWYKTLEKIGAVVSITPLQPQQLVPWLEKRLHRAGLKVDREALQLLALYSEGNVLAAAQAIEKLSLLYLSDTSTEQTITAQQVLEANTDHARYDVFRLADATLQSDYLAIVRIIFGLKAIRIEPTLILWALAKELRALTQIQWAIDHCGKTLAKALEEQGIWEKKKPWVIQTLKRHSSDSLQVALQHASHIDSLIKGAVVGNVWDQLLDLSLAIAGYTHST